jgi:hypothetical protein
MHDDLKADFRNFLYVVWKFLKLPDPTPIQYDIAHFLQHGPRRKGVEAFRGVGKSWITAAYVVWRLYCDPQLNILVVSASKTRADNFTTFCRLLIDGIPALHHLKPRPNQRDSKISFDVGPAEPDQSPSVMSAGITGQITGMRADEIVPDDIEVPNNSATQMMREKLSESVKEFDAILKPDGKITFLGTPQTESSVYNALCERGYVFRIWPARYPDEKQRNNYGDKLAPMIRDAVEAKPSLAGRTTEPKRFTDIDLVEREASYGRAGFALQFMLDTRLSDADRYPLKLRDLIVCSLDPENAPEKLVWAAAPEWIVSDLPNVGMGLDRMYRPVPLKDTNYLPYTQSVLVIDPAGRGKDETAWAVLKFLNGYIYLLDAGGFPPGSGYAAETLQALADKAKQFKVNKVIYEANFGDGMFGQLLKPVMAKTWPCGMEEVKHSVQKERRICDTLEPVMNSHRLVVSRDLVKRDFDSTSSYAAEDAQKYQLFYQLTRVTREKGALAQDDRLDALAMGVAYFAAAMATDVDKAVARGREAAMQAELRKFMKHTTGRTGRGNVWASRPA